MARRMSKPDLRPKWSDPSLTCIRDYRMANGERKIEIDPDYERRYRAHMMQASPLPNWRRDEMYFARRKR